MNMYMRFPTDLSISKTVSKTISKTVRSNIKNFEM